MEQMQFGWTGVAVPVIGQGTWMIEGGQAAESEAVRALQAGLELGMTHLDTAEMYGSGRAEELVGDAIAGRRKEVFLVSKVLPSNASYDGTLRACDRSLQRLRSDYLDLYLLHWAGRHPLAETMRAMEDLVSRGLVRFIGVSNFDVEQVRWAEGALRHERLACNQVLYHLGARGVERRLIPYCRHAGIAVVGYSPFGHGDFPQPDSPSGRVLARIAGKHSRTVRQVALRFLTRDGVFAIPKSARPAHTGENAAGAGWNLDAEDLTSIDAAFPAPDHDVPLAML